MASDNSFVEDPIFRNLKGIKESLAAKNQPLVPALIDLFTSFHTKLISEFQALLNNTVESIKRECSSPACHEKDITINSLKMHVSQLEKKLEESDAKFEEKIECTEAYERRDTLIISGSVPPAATSEATSKVVIELVKKKFPQVQIENSDISVSHRLQSKRPNRQGVTPPPNIYVKLVRRELKRELIEASRKQPRESHDRIFINESLTPKRTRIRQTLLNMKKAHGNIIRIWAWNC